MSLLTKGKTVMTIVRVAMGADGAVLCLSLMLPPKGTLPVFPTVFKGESLVGMAAGV